MRSSHPAEPVESSTSTSDNPRRWQLRGYLSSRARRLVAGVATTVLTRGIGILVPLMLVPVTLDYLGPNLYGLWMAVAALTGMAAFADLGLGNSLMTKLAPCYATGDTRGARRYVSNAYLSLGVLAGVACAVLWSSAGIVPWSSIFNADGSAAATEARSMALACVSAFVINVPLSLINRVQYAYQQIAQSNAWQAAGSLLALPLTFGAVHLHLAPYAVVAASVFAPVLMNAANTLWFFQRQMRELRPAITCVDRATARNLLQLSGLFLALTIVMSVANSMDTLVITHALGLASVTAFAVPARLFAQLGLLVSVVNLPFWTANADALARGETAWVRRAAHRMIVVSVLMATATSLVLVCVGDRLLSMWLGTSLGTDQWLLSGLAVWWVLLAAISPCFMVQNAAGVVRPQLLGWSLYLAASIPVKWYAARHFGLPAVPYAGALIYLITVLPAALRGYRRALAGAASADVEPTRKEMADDGYGAAARVS
ncbi:lipopolysaccharide biosynthesis protein [Krasilnikovia sp. M28-CT-15]|uniref:lipopolysaccharide biosynthesis protein n=1 Tax=Krasilnikovia sp. M28-CT-15 TaxID=3373540 RepID=UPI00387607C3